MTDLPEWPLSPRRDRTAQQDGLVVEGLTVVTEGRGTPVVEDITFRVAPGQVLGLVGESGSGKSTVGVALLGLARKGLAHRGGRVCIDGVDILALTRQGAAGRPRPTGRLRAAGSRERPQPGATGRRQLREAIIIHRRLRCATARRSSSACTQLMDEVGLPATDAFLNSYPHQMSGGQQQRVGIAMAFSCRPRVIVLDEPTTGLDVTTQRRVLETVRQMTVEHQVTSVYVSHDLAVVAQLADQTAVLYAGRLVEHARTEAIFRGARHPYAVGLLKAVPSPARSEILVGIEGRPPRPGRWPRAAPSPTGATPSRTCADRNCRRCAISGDAEPHWVRCHFPEPPVSVDQAKQPVPALSGRPRLGAHGAQPGGPLWAPRGPARRLAST